MYGASVELWSDGYIIMLPSGQVQPARIRTSEPSSESEPGKEACPTLYSRLLACGQVLLSCLTTWVEVALIRPPSRPRRGETCVGPLCFVPHSPPFLDSTIAKASRTAVDIARPSAR